MKKITIEAIIGISAVFSVVAASSVFANPTESEKVESRKVTLANVLPSTFSCYASSYYGATTSNWLLDNVSGLPENTALPLWTGKTLKHPYLTSWGFEIEDGIQRCPLVAELQKFLEKNDGKIDVDLTITTHTKKSDPIETCDLDYPNMHGCDGKPKYWICDIEIREEMKIVFPNGLMYKDNNAPTVNYYQYNKDCF